jgi:hypothetical protein
MIELARLEKPAEVEAVLSAEQSAGPWGGSPGGGIGAAFDPASSRLATAGNALKAGKGGMLGGLVSDLASVGLGKLISECECE